MKHITAALLLLITAPTTSAFSTCSNPKQSRDVQLFAVDRRAFLSSAAVASTMAITMPAFAAGEARFEDMKQIVNLGYSLDALAKKVASPDTFEEALPGLIQFNKDGNFYNNYARNFISKSGVKNNADGDPRVAKIRQASKIIASCQELLDGHEGPTGQEAATEASSRVKKAQKLISEFLSECPENIANDDRVKGYVSTHS